MRIFVDARYVRAGQTGIGWATDSLVRALATLPTHDEIIAATMPNSPLQKACMTRLHPLTVHIDYQWHPLGELYLQFGLPRLAQRLQADIYWSPAYYLPTACTRFSKVVTIHDLTVFDHPHEYPGLFAPYLRWIIRRSVAAADAVICISDFTRAALCQLFPDFSRKCVTIPMGVDDCFFNEPSSRADLVPELPAKFVLTIGAGSPRKNAPYGAQIVQALREKLGLSYDYVVVGRDCRLPDWVIQLPPQTKDSLVTLYRKASLLLMPSASEGFGIPVLEAMASGCPVAIANRGALPEVAANAAAFVFALEEEPDAVAARLAEILCDETKLSTCREKGLQRARLFRWNKIAAQVRNLFASLTGDSENC